MQTFKSALKRSIQDQLAGTEGEHDERSPYWSHLVPSMLYAYRCSPHTALGGLSPAEVVFGRHLLLPGDHVFTSGVRPDLRAADHKSAVLDRIRFLTDVVPTLRAKSPPQDTHVARRGIVFRVWDRV